MEKFILDRNIAKIITHNVSFTDSGTDYIINICGTDDLTSAADYYKSEGIEYTVEEIDTSAYNYIGGQIFGSYAAAVSAVEMGEAAYTQMLYENEQQQQKDKYWAELEYRLLLLEQQSGLYDDAEMSAKTDRAVSDNRLAEDRYSELQTIPRTDIVIENKKG